MEKLDVMELEYHELVSLGWSNIKFGIRCKTTPKTYEEDFSELVIEVKKKLQEIVNQSKKEVSINKK